MAYNKARYKFICLLYLLYSLLLPDRVHQLRSLGVVLTFDRSTHKAYRCCDAIFVN